MFIESVPARESSWAQDEARLGLIPIVRRVWARRGKRPWRWGSAGTSGSTSTGFVRPGGGQVQWLILPEVDTEVFSLALKHFAEAVGAGPRKRSRAGGHPPGDPHQG